MSAGIENIIAWPLNIGLQAFTSDGHGGSIEIGPGITTLVGPNGSGKTRALRAIKTRLDQSGYIARDGRNTFFLAAGRSSPLEQYRAAISSPYSIETRDLAVGQAYYKDQWWGLESVTGSLLALDARSDLKLKIESRLQQLFDRSVQLSWSQAGLEVRFTPMGGGNAYAANHEASGILHLVALLAAIHNDKIGALIIDEPEISLHPQHQAFLLEEMERVAGDPADPAKKIIVIATHSASMLPLRSVSELPKIIFFNNHSSPPAQVPAEAGILRRSKLIAFIARLGATHRIAMFAERVLLVEGPSDETIATQLARRLEMRMLARNAYILPVTGKGEFDEAARLFRLLNKKVAVLADLDALADANDLVNHFSQLPAAQAVADRLGRSSIVDLDGDLRTDLGQFIDRNKDAVDTAAQGYEDWSSQESSGLSKRRVTLARILTDPSSFGAGVSSDAQSLRTRYDRLLSALQEMGCFFLRRGAIENYYNTSGGDLSKPNKAAEEAASFETNTYDDLVTRYADVLVAFSYIAPNQRIDEDKLLRPKLGAALSAVMLSMDRESSEDQLNNYARATIGADAEVFRFYNVSDQFLKVRIEIASQLFQRDTFPFEFSQHDNASVVIPAKLPGHG